MSEFQIRPGDDCKAPTLPAKLTFKLTKKHNTINNPSQNCRRLAGTIQNSAQRRTPRCSCVFLRAKRRARAERTVGPNGEKTIGSHKLECEPADLQTKSWDSSLQLKNMIRDEEGRARVTPKVGLAKRDSLPRRTIRLRDTNYRRQDPTAQTLRCKRQQYDNPQAPASCK